MLVYFCAVGYKTIEVVNGGGKGGPMEDIHLFDPEKAQKKDQVFLDYYSGDFFHYNGETSMWVPEGNVGLHSSTAIDFKHIGNEENIKKVKTYKATSIKHSNKLQIAKLYDAKCIVRK